MAKEELEKEIKNYIDKNCNQWETDGLTVDDIVRIAVLDFAEPREKRIAELEEKLANADYQLEGRDNEIRELKAQIEGIKRYLDCEYCEHYTQPCGCKNCNEEIRSDWKLKEIKEK